MKRIFLIAATVLFSLSISAQTYDPIKNLVILRQFKKAKEDFDKGMGNAKFAAKPEAYILKTVIYSSMSSDPSVKGTPAEEEMNNDAYAAFKKYQEMEPALTLINDAVYQTGPINLYSTYYTNGYNDYANKKWESGFEKLKKAVEFSDLLIERKLVNLAIDTNVLILAGITAENSNHKDDAAKFYVRLADKKIAGDDGYESVYRFLVVYFFSKKDIPSFEKYKAIGKEVFPKSDYFDYDKVDFAVGLESGFDAKLKALEDILATEPNNFKANEIIGELIYDTLNPRKEASPIPANADELEKKMVTSFGKAAAANPDFENPYLYLGDHFISKAVKIDEERKAFAATFKATSKEDVAKRDALDKKYGDALEQAREPYENACKIFSNRAAKNNNSLEVRDKQQYKKAASYLDDIFTYKKIQSKNNPADLAKYTTEEKKWNDVYENISKIADKKKSD
jgi:hypothetical protein